MPTMPLGPCSQPGCPGRAVAHGRCATHARAERARYDSERGSSAARGYGYEWRKIRDAYLAGHPWCEVCGELATDVDHIVSRRRGGTDDDSNLMSLCHTHHSRKTAKQDGRWGKNQR